jgi:uncharacterized protein (TIGR00299 family) protein
VAHFDCFSGISGDMTLGALVDGGVPGEAIRDAVASLGLPITMTIDKVRKGGFAATRVHVEAPHEHKHRHLPAVEEILSRGRLSTQQRDLAVRIFRRLAEAEAAVHGMPIEKVHFHEVGALDSIADIAGAAVGLDVLGAERFTSGPVATGTGLVQCAHGMMPIPTPGTAELLKGIPLRASSIKAELTTPTGAAILATVVQEWTDIPSMVIEKIGHGAGSRDLAEQPNILRLLVGQSHQAVPVPETRDQIWAIETNLDDVPAEIIGYCMDLLFAAGAVDVFCTPIMMKKNRPGVLLSVLAPEAAVPRVEEILFRETMTFGIRRYAVDRHKLQRQTTTIQTPWGPVQGKLGWLEGQAPILTPEYEDCARVARAHGVPLREVFEKVRQSYRP